MAIFTAIGAAIFGAGTFAAAATAAALEVGVGIAVSLIGKSLSGSSDSKTSPTGVKLNLQSGSDVPRSIIFGYGATAGSMVYSNEWGNVDGTPNAYLTQVICLSDYPVQSLQQVWISGELVTLDGSPDAAKGYPVLEYRKDGVDHLWIKFYDGTQTAADTFLTGTVSSASRPYGSTRVGTGCAYVIATALVEDSLFSGYPSFTFALNGAKLYDVSKDTTAGGSGSQRLATPSTWGGDGDFLPAVQIYNILAGITSDGQWLYGLQGLPIARLPNADWVDVVNKCRATITGPGGSEATYRSGGEISVSTQLASAVEAMLTTCQGRIAEIGGTYKLHVGAPGSAVFSFSDDEIISTQEQSFTPFFGLADTINGISATYPSPTQGWNPFVAPALYRSDYEAIDGARRLMADVSLDMVPYDGQVQRLMKSALQEARRARRHTFVLPPEAFVLEPNDVIEWTSVRNGYSAKQFRVDGISDLANLDVMVDITEVDPADYDWDQATDYTGVVDGSVVRVRPAPQPMTGWGAIPARMVDPDGNGWLPTIEISYADSLSDIRAVRIQVREGWDDKRLIFDGEVAYDIAVIAPSVIINASFLPNRGYEARGIYLPFSGRVTRWSNQDIDGTDGAWLSVTTPNVAALPPKSVFLETLETDLQNAVGIITVDTPGSVIDQLNQIVADVGELANAVVTGTETARKRISTLVAQTATSRAAIIQTQEAIATETMARATAIEELTASLGNFVADGYLKLEAAVDTVSATASISAKVKAVGLTAYSQAAWILRASVTEEGDDAAFAVLGKLYVMVPGGDGSFVTALETLDDGTVKFSGTRMGRIDSLDGRSYIDFTDGIDIYSESN